MNNQSQLTRAEMKKVMGGNVPVEGGRCSVDRLCAFDGPQGQYLTGGCQTMSTGQCRCVAYKDGSPWQSVPHSGCLASVD